MAVDKSAAHLHLPPSTWFADFISPDSERRARQLCEWAPRAGLVTLPAKDADTVPTYHICIPLRNGEFIRLLSISSEVIKGSEKTGRPEFDIGSLPEPSSGDPSLRSYAPFDASDAGRQLYLSVCALWGKPPKAGVPKYVLGEWRMLHSDPAFAGLLQLCEGVIAQFELANPGLRR